MKQAREMSKSGHGFAFLKSNIFSPHYHELIRTLLLRSKVLVACAKDDEHQIFGYLVYEPLPKATIVHMTYTKFTFRKMGIAKELWNLCINTDNPIYHTADGYLFSKFTKSNLTYNPFLLWDQLREYKHDAIRATDAG